MAGTETTCDCIGCDCRGGRLYNGYHMGHAATKPDKVNILLCDINEGLIMMWL